MMGPEDHSYAPTPSTPRSMQKKERQDVAQEENIEYPTGFRFVVVLLAMCVVDPHGFDSSPLSVKIAIDRSLVREMTRTSA